MKSREFKGFCKERQKKVEQKLEEFQVEVKTSLEKLNELMITPNGRYAIDGVLDAIMEISPHNSNYSYMEAYYQTQLELQFATDDERQRLVEMIPLIRKLLKGYAFIDVLREQNLHRAF